MQKNRGKYTSRVYDKEPPSGGLSGIVVSVHQYPWTVVLLSGPGSLATVLSTCSCLGHLAPNTFRTGSLDPEQSGGQS